MDARDVAAVTGVIAITIGLALFSVPLALIVLGAFLLLGAVASQGKPVSNG